MDSAGVDGGGHDNGQLSRNFADQRLGHIYVTLHRLDHIFPVGVVLAVKDAVAVQTDDVSPLEIVHFHPLLDNGAFFLHGDRGGGQLGNTAGIHGHVPVGGQLLLNPF